MEYKDILVIPDIHFRPFWKKIINTDLPVVFLGDYLDGYEYEGYSFEEGFNNFQEIIEFAKERPDDITLLVGNHCCHYLGISCDCSRFDYQHAPQIFKLFKENEYLFQGALIYNNALFTHAGVTNRWLEQREIREDPEFVAKFINNQIKFSDELIIPSWWSCGDSEYLIADIGRSRGGYAPSGGPLWADVSDIYNGPAFKDQITQIFGHSQLTNTGTFMHKDNWYMCDSRAVFIWNGEELKIYD